MRLKMLFHPRYHKVCIIHKVTRPDVRSYYKQARSLANAGYNVYVLGLFHYDFSGNGIKILGVPPPKSRFVKFTMTNFRILLRAIKLRAAIIHFHDIDFLPWALVLRCLTHARIIYDIHEAYPDYILLKPYIPKVLRKPLSFLVYFLEHMGAKFCDALMPNDNFVADAFAHRRKIIVYNFPCLDFFAGFAVTPFQDRHYDLFYHGSLPKYHYNTMFKIAASLNQKQIHTRWGIMPLHTRAGAEMKREALRQRVGKNFEFLPFTSYLSVAGKIQQTKIGIIPLPPLAKFYKNIPLKMFEFMGCGVPMVLADLPPSRQFVAGLNCCFAVQPDDIDAYVDAITFLLNHPAVAAQMGENGKKSVFEKYNWSTEEAKLLRLYKSWAG
ncbi:glycosyltransferase [candidate division KSB1 bacterium]|nr:glycosyltransferase [candidate division KSB1 bacterium]RQW01097.1 MAG: glycosyltransferase [candidate division KSB1 bacterium]